MLFSSIVGSLLGLCSLLIPTVWAQPGPFDPTGFNFVGRIDSMTLNTTGGILAGGSITVDGITIVVPENLLVTLPSIAVAWSELFSASGQPLLPRFGQVSWDVNVFGNLINDEYIAGLIYIVQDSTQILQGYISAIDLDTGIFTVGMNANAPPNTGFKLILNDPLGVFGRPYTDNPLWTVDPVNPSIRSVTGFPLCIPRNSSDPLCSDVNRPKDTDGNFLTTFTFPDPATVQAGDPDPHLMVPLHVGDFVTFSATDVGNGLFAVYSLNANLGIFTAPGTKPVGNYSLVAFLPN
ncbi:hypothetical protein M422DRAFT_260124 [Sphaerobolus stellatus SS14]|uniref:Uncharacterized protein n=1 Tax=Sphaerobolus stellatus (strain SS14) TaxID=990650 RepID=A0A0C9U3N2_SPHS4|nr:hypothetical protein M422DRAFT_260124 [Sphaerobolus stellatus SS14]